MDGIMKMWRDTVDARPDKTAVSMRDVSYTFRGLDELARGIAARVPSGEKPMPVAVLAERAPETAAMFLAALYSGNFYVPLDPGSPAEKLESIMEELSPAALLGPEGMRDKFSVSCPYLSTNDRADVYVPAQERGPDDPLYMICTSGSTGKPKGVIKSRRAMMSFLDSFCRAFEFSPDEILGCQTPFFFDASARDFYMMLSLGVTLELLPPELFAVPTSLVEYMNGRGVTLLTWVPSAMTMLSRFDTFSYIRPETVRRVFFVGEVMPAKTLEYWRSALPGVRFVNLYGSAEMAGVCCACDVTDEKQTVIPMGAPLPGCRVYLLDGDGSIVTSPGETGELAVVSDALADGYYNDAERTRERFPVMDFGHGPERCLLTGDTGKYDARGRLVFSSRSDDQIKHMGYRIEPGEIESAARDLPGVEDCCCAHDAARDRLILYVRGTAVPADVRRGLRKKLPAYMLPARVIAMQELPVNANGKTDRTALKMRAESER